MGQLQFFNFLIFFENFAHFCKNGHFMGQVSDLNGGDKWGKKARTTLNLRQILKIFKISHFWRFFFKNRQIWQPRSPFFYIIYRYIGLTTDLDEQGSGPQKTQKMGF